MTDRPSPNAHSEPGSCGDPECHVLHADPSNPIHPPFYVDSRMQQPDACPFCAHDRHDDVFCNAHSACDCGSLHRCACSFPDPSNYAEVPA